MAMKLKTDGGWTLIARCAHGLAAWRGMVGALLLVIPLLASPLPAAAAQQTFATPEAAVAALLDALRADDDAALLALFGDEHQRLVASPDRALNSATRAQSLARLEAYHLLEATAPGRRTLLVGNEAWPFPIPLVREGESWRFATELGEDELINRRIGANEREAIAVLRAYLDAQRQYAASDRDGDGVLEYAQRLASQPGKQDGLYWPADPEKNEEISPFGPLIAAGGDYLKGHRTGDSYRGYHFRILTRQGRSAPGGAFSYIINGNMIAGFALIAYPAEYGESGVMSFIVSNNGKIYEKNIAQGAAQIRQFNPDATWRPLSEAY